MAVSNALTFTDLHLAILLLALHKHDHAGEGLSPGGVTMTDVDQIRGMIGGAERISELLSNGLLINELDDEGRPTRKYVITMAGIKGVDRIKNGTAEVRSYTTGAKVSAKASTAGQSATAPAGVNGGGNNKKGRQRGSNRSATRSAHQERTAPGSDFEPIDPVHPASSQGNSDASGPSVARPPASRQPSPSRSASRRGAASTSPGRAGGRRR